MGVKDKILKGEQYERESTRGGGKERVERVKRGCEEERMRYGIGYSGIRIKW